MSVLTAKVPAELAARLERFASRRKVSKSEIVREALEAALDKPELKREVSAHDLMKDGCGIIRTGKRDLASNKKHMAGYGR